MHHGYEEGEWIGRETNLQVSSHRNEVQQHKNQATKINEKLRKFFGPFQDVTENFDDNKNIKN